MAESTMTLSVMERRTVQEIRSASHKQFWAHQHSSATYLASAAGAYIRSLAALALKNDPQDITWKQIATAMMKEHEDIFLLCQLLTARASYLTGPYADKLDVPFRGIVQGTVRSAPCPECTDYKLNCRGSFDGAHHCYDITFHACM